MLPNDSVRLEYLHITNVPRRLDNYNNLVQCIVIQMPSIPRQFCNAVKLNIALDTNYGAIAVLR